MEQPSLTARAHPLDRGAGSAAAEVVVLAASLVGSMARVSADRWDDAGGATAQAEALRARALPLVEADAEAFRTALDALRQPQALEERGRDHTMGVRLERAAEVPLAIAETALDVALLASELIAHADPDMRADAVAACMLAEGAARAAAHLVEINLGTTESDSRVKRARAVVEEIGVLLGRAGEASA